SLDARAALRGVTALARRHAHAASAGTSALDALPIARAVALLPECGGGFATRRGRVCDHILVDVRPTRTSRASGSLKARSKGLFIINAHRGAHRRSSMLEKKIGEPCPNCATPLMRRRSTFRTIVGDVAYCARCCSSFELAKEEDTTVGFGPPPEF